MSTLAPTKNGNAAKYIEQALKEHQLVILHFRKCKEHILKCGLFFKAAQDAAIHGDFNAVLFKYEDLISQTSVYRYIAFANEVVEWVKAVNPKCEGLENILKEGTAMVLQSPKGYIALMRQLGEMRKFGEYDEVKYKAKKLLGDSKQLSFSFAELSAHIDVFATDFRLELPDGRDEAEALTELETKLETALNAVRQRKQTIDIPA